MLFAVCVSRFQVQPSEFYAMTMEELGYLFEFNAPQSKGDYAGSLTRGSVDELTEWMDSWDEPAPS